MSTAAQIEHAWRQLEDGAALDDLRRHWEQLVTVRHELDEAVLALATRIEQLRLEAVARDAEDAAEDADQAVVTEDADPAEF